MDFLTLVSALVIVAVSGYLLHIGYTSVRARALNDKLELNPVVWLSKAMRAPHVKPALFMDAPLIQRGLNGIEVKRFLPQTQR